MRHREEFGETLVEILIAIVIIGMVVGAIFATYATAATSSKSQRDLVTADTVLRSAAELTKSSVRSQCTSGPSTYSVDFSGLASGSVTPPPKISNSQCPSPSAVRLVTLTATWPGHTQSLEIDVRAP